MIIILTKKKNKIKINGNRYLVNISVFPINKKTTNDIKQIIFLCTYYTKFATYQKPHLTSIKIKICTYCRKGI